MFFLWRSSVSSSPFGRSPGFGLSLIIHGLLFVLFGVAILGAPELLAYIVATFLTFVGIGLLVTGWRLWKLGRSGW
jgi:vacuolar-type H+-ATPase subunit I/STV1